MLLIGELAEQTGLAPSAIRYYEDLGLVQPVTRRSGRRVFDNAAANRLRAITAAQEAGFTLDEVRRLLDSQAAGTRQWKAMVKAKIADVRARIERLEVVEATLRESLRCGCRAWDECPIVLEPRP